MERRPTHLASESSSGAVLRILALWDDIVDEELAEKTWISRAIDAVEKVRGLTKQREAAAVVVVLESRGARRSEPVAVAMDGTLARWKVQRADICL